MDEMMIPVVDLSEAYKLREELANHPLYKRRGEVEQAFLDELTHLTRKYGLEIKADTRSEYGETYPEHSLETPYHGTEGRYLVGSFGIEFSAAQKENLLPCDAKERTQFDAAKRQRKDEDKIISDLSRRISDANYKAKRLGMENMFNARLAQLDKKPVTSFHCSCGEKFKSEAKLKAHATETGHRA